MKLRQEVILIKEWALETKHRRSGERMLMAIHSELYDKKLDDQASGVVSELEALRHAPYETEPPLGLEQALKRVETSGVTEPHRRSRQDRP